MLPSYREILARSKAQIEEAKAPIRAKQVKKQGELEMLKIEEKLASLEEQILSHASQYPVPFDKLLDALDEKALLERRMKQFQEILSDMFPTEPK